MNSLLAQAGCDTSNPSLNLADCLLLNNEQTVADVYSQPSSLVNIIVPNLFIAGGIIVFFLFIFAGFKFISAGTKGKEEAQQIITTGIIGLVVMFAAYWIMQIIQLITGTNLGL